MGLGAAKAKSEAAKSDDEDEEEEQVLQQISMSSTSWSIARSCCYGYCMKAGF